MLRASAKGGTLSEMCSQCTLRELCLPLSLGAEEVRALDQIVVRCGPFEPGDKVFRAGEPLHALLAVSSGMVKCRRVDALGREHVLGFHISGELFGLDAIHAGTHRCDAVALSRVTVCAFPYREYSEISAATPALRENLVQLLSRRIDLLECRAGHSSAGERIAELLVDLLERHERRGLSMTDLDLSMSRQDIANYLGIATETVSRELAKLHGQGVIDVARRHIGIVDRTALVEKATCLKSGRHTH